MRAVLCAALLVNCAAATTARSPPIEALRPGVDAAAAPSRRLAEAASGHIVVASATCPPKTYYWGIWSGRHYCVYCPTGTTSTGCTQCKPDPARSTCVKNNPLSGVNCGKGKFIQKSAQGTYLDCKATCANPIADKRCFHCWDTDSWNEHAHTFCKWYPSDPLCRHKCGASCAKNPLAHKGCHYCWSQVQWEEYYPTFCTWFPQNKDCLADNFCPVECEHNPLYNTMCTDCWSHKQWTDFFPVYCIWYPHKPDCANHRKSMQYGAGRSHPRKKPTSKDCQSKYWDLRTADYCCEVQLPEYIRQGKTLMADKVHSVCHTLFGSHMKKTTTVAPTTVAPTPLPTLPPLYVGEERPPPALSMLSKEH